MWQTSVLATWLTSQSETFSNRGTSPDAYECRALRLDVGAVDRSAFRNRVGPRQGIKQLQPEAAPRPAVEAVVDRRRRAVVGRTVTPSASDLQDVQDARDYPPVINTPRSRLVLWQMRLDRSPCLI